jgi:hypothetical protein
MDIKVPENEEADKPALQNEVSPQNEVGPQNVANAIDKANALEPVDLETFDIMEPPPVVHADEWDDPEVDISQQEILETLLDSVDPTAAEWAIPVSLEGELDLSFIENRGFDCIKKIVFQAKGRITALHNVPKQIEVLFATRQRLTSVDSFYADPTKSRLEELFLDDNPIDDVRAIALFPRLRLLSMKRHRCTEIEALPATLEELYIDGGALETLSLISRKGTKEEDLQNLAVLHIDDNRVPLVVYHMPASVVDFQQGASQVEVIAASDEQSHKKQREIRQTTDFHKALDQYSQLLRDYERKVFPRSHPDNLGQGPAAPKAAIPCINCGQTGGTLFRRENNHYIAKCGHSARPCALDIKLFCGVHGKAATLLADYEETVRDAEQEIIRLRLETVFGFISEDASKQKAKKQIRLYEDAKAVHEKLQGRSKAFNEAVVKERLNEWAQLNQTIHEQTSQLKERMRQYKESNDPKQLTELIRFQAEVLEPLRKKQREARYDPAQMYVETQVENKDSVSQLFQTAFDLDRGEELSTAEPPRVVRFTL